MPAHKSHLELVRAADNFPYIDIARTPYHEDEGSAFYQLLLPNDPRPHGYLLPSTVKKMPWNSHFQITHDAPRTVQVLDSSDGKDIAGAINRDFSTVIENAIQSKAFAVLGRPHHEDFKILGARHPPVQLLRTAASLFGITCRGAHMTAYQNTEEGMKIWVPRRSAHLFTYPNMLDTTVAGGVRAEESPFECILHEADEEASLQADLVREHTRACGVLTYVAQSDAQNGENYGCMVPDCLYVYDIELPAGVVPKPRDEEVKEFYLWDVERVKEALVKDEFKTNCAAVMIDFFIRHGIITDENEKDYLEIVSRLHRVLPVPTSPTAP
ncbi:NUDIX hydrolase domain-like protein [Lophiotrema nucula]|uniref:NUDIX hydrolase domain-like protein n=1 Tax=Lophiotrema nucula TaxID=690887 RepID=A0A6A5ZNU5_9PLEO|nr:NUDIX hydrolase domain-like protein [Lophiotrema nucula]